MKVFRKPINELNELEKSEIDSFIELNGGLIFHETKFNEIASGTFNSNLSYFLAYIDMMLVGICPVHSIKRGILINSYSNNGSFEIPYGGWVFDGKYTVIQDLWNALPLHLNESFTYWAFSKGTPEKYRELSKKYQTGIVNLGCSEKELFEEVINSKRRNMIRKAEKSGIFIKDYGVEGLPVYFKFKQGTYKKAGLQKPRVDYYEKILNSYYSTGKAMLMIAFHNEKPLSGVIITGNENVMHYWQGSSMNDIPNLGQGELLQWESIKWARARGAKYYDLCVIEQERLPLIAQFKMGFSKELTPFYCFGKKPLSFKVLNKIQNVFPN